MLQKIQSSEVKNRNSLNVRQNNARNQQFGGVGDLILQGVQMCERHPMVNVSVLDLSTAIVPRTIIEAYSGDATVDENGNKKRKANVFAGMEAFRREASGLVINCLIPGFIVAGVAKLIQRPIMNGFNKTNLSGVWANSDSLDKVSKFYLEAKGANKEEKVLNMYKNMLNSLEGADGDVAKKGNIAFSSFADLDKNAKELADATLGDKSLKDAYKNLIAKTHIGEHIRFKGEENYFSTNLETLMTNTSKLVKEFHKENITTEKGMTDYIAKAKKLVKYKSLAGLALILPLAISAQPINRWLTRRASGKKGAPIYDEFKDKDSKTEVNLSAKDKAALFKQKVISVSSMLGVALLSMMKMPNMKMLEFSGIFPSMDMARIVATSTFASRMAASEDKNELQLATVRDITTFASMYFLGDYAAKGVATAMEKSNPNLKLLNRFKDVDKDANVFKKFWNWVKNTSLKSSDELVTSHAKNMRTWCQVANIGFSLALLGLLVPMLTVGSAQKGRKKDIEAQKQNTLATSNGTGTTGAAAPAAKTTSTDSIASTSKSDTAATDRFHKFSFDRFNSKVG
ncbi:MAG: hypothetical protein NC390_08050 [Fusobacterium sp.]|nr:hypothetical protein [Fusobacterium sp.]